MLDLERLDEIPFVSHDDLYNSQFPGVESRLNDLADSDGFITLGDLVEVKQWVAEVTGVENISIFSQGETVFVFLGAGGDLKEDRVLVADVLNFLQSNYAEEDIGKVNTANLVKGLGLADF